MSSPEHKLDQLAESLRKAEERRNIFVPPALDREILKQARERLTGESKGRPFGFWNWFALSTATALIAAIIFLVPRIKTPVVAREDINRDGQVDIIDAMALAKVLENPGANPAYDQNGDGRLNEADVRAVALVAVRVDRKS
jgi:hypothetical protein